MSFEIGDRVWTSQFGSGIVVNIDDEDIYSVEVDFQAYEENHTYTVEGKVLEDDLYPSLYHHGTKIIPAPEPVRCPFKQYDRVLVRDGADEKWKLVLFAEFCSGARFPFRVFKSFDLSSTTPFAHCIPFEGNEHLIGTVQEPDNAQPTPL